jgi:hypothetical protein
MTGIPEGFRKISRLSPFNNLVGPLYGGRRIIRASAIFARDANSE